MIEKFKLKSSILMIIDWTFLIDFILRILSFLCYFVRQTLKWNWNFHKKLENYLSLDSEIAALSNRRHTKKAARILEYFTTHITTVQQAARSIGNENKASSNIPLLSLYLQRCSKYNKKIREKEVCEINGVSTL